MTALRSHLACNTCGHWEVRAFTKDEVADWLRDHPGALIRVARGPDRKSVCPHPCGTPMPTPDDEPCGVEGCRICPAVFGGSKAGAS